MIAPIPGSSILLNDGSAVSSRNVPPSISGRVTKNTQSRVTALNLNRRHRPQGLDEARR